MRDRLDAPRHPRPGGKTDGAHRGRRANRWCSVAEETERRLAVGYFRRLYPSLRLMKSLVDRGYLGDGASVSRRRRRALLVGGRDPRQHAPRSGRRRRADRLTALTSSTRCSTCFDEPFEVIAYQDNSLGGVEADCVIDARLTHGAKTVDGRIEVARTRELGQLRSRRVRRRRSRHSKSNERFRVRVVAADRATPSTRSMIDRAPFSLEARWRRAIGRRVLVRDVPDCRSTTGCESIRQGREPRLSGRSAVATARMIDACYARPAPMAEPWVSEGLELEAARRAGHEPALAGACS